MRSLIEAEWLIYASVNYTTTGSDNGLWPGQCQAIIWTNAGILLTGPLGTNSSEILIEIRTFSFKKMHLKMSSGKWRPLFLGLNVLTHNLNSSVPVTQLSLHWSVDMTVYRSKLVASSKCHIAAATHYSNVSNHWSLNCLFNILPKLTTKNMNAQHYWPFVWGIYWWVVDSHEGTVM